MAEGGKVVSIVPLKGTNYPSWKLQCKMALVREGLWGIVAGTEPRKAPDATTEADKHRQVYGAERPRPGHDQCVGYRSFVTLPRWRPCGSSGSLKEAVWTIPEEDLGK